MKFNQTKLKSLRKEKNMTLADVASASNVALSAVGHWELGTRTPSGQSLMNLSRALGVEPSFFFD
jgi:transcriptional regulator with XRE-family HTH domain